jgi:hypothetical protein
MRRVPSRLAIVLVALCVGVGLVARLGHHVLVAHASCPAHGELVHAGPGLPVGHHAAAHAPRAESDAPSWSAPGDDDDAHEHCDALATTASLSLARAAAPLSLAPSFELLEPARAVPRARTRLLLLLAPKTSPPS